MQKALLAAAVAVALLITYIDSLPTWDDAGVIGLFVLAIGLWIPLRRILLTHDFRLLIVLLFPLVGVYAGRAPGKLARKLLQS
jgi:hypothetical protein